MNAALAIGSTASGSGNSNLADDALNYLLRAGLRHIVRIKIGYLRRKQVIAHSKSTIRMQVFRY